MADRQVKALLELAGEKVPCGIYAVRRGIDYYELRNEPMTKTQLKKTRNEYRALGIKVYCNGI